ncbi:MAG: glutaminase [Actinobacteria bacterium]|nr:glutaminase [Actinomycetota bacterium]
MTTAARDLLAAARLRLAEAPRERYGELVQRRRILGVPRAPRVEPRGSAWHLGVLLLTDDGLLATGEIVRAREEVRRGFPAESQRRRAELAAAARRGGFAEGETAHVGWRRIDPDAADDVSEILQLRDGVPSVRWSASGGFIPLSTYLEERIELLLRPLLGSS